MAGSGRPDGRPRLVTYKGARQWKGLLTEPDPAWRAPLRSPWTLMAAAATSVGCMPSSPSGDDLLVGGV